MMPEAPTFTGARKLHGDWTVLSSFLPVPGVGGLPVNAFLLRGREPLLVDTGTPMLRDEFMAALEQQMDLEDLRWIWLSHTDADHTGALRAVLERAPRAEVVTTFVGYAKMQLLGLPTDRARILQPGENLDIGDRRLAPVRPPWFDAPETLGFLDPRDNALFVADCFGALLHDVAETAEEVVRHELMDGLTQWAAIDAPWLQHVDRRRFAQTLASVERIAPSVLLSAHLPPARSNVGALLRDSGRAVLDSLDIAPTDAVSMEGLLARAA
ncbi:MAG: MBL fold metallo-hydrolase [Beijerinckiaceae bacterium]